MERSRVDTKTALSTVPFAARAVSVRSDALSPCRVRPRPRCPPMDIYTTIDGGVARTPRSPFPPPVHVRGVSSSQTTFTGRYRFQYRTRPFTTNQNNFNLDRVNNITVICKFSIYRGQSLYIYIRIYIRVYTLGR